MRHINLRLQLLEPKGSSRNYLAQASPFQWPPEPGPNVTGPESHAGLWGPALGSQLYLQHRLGVALSKWLVAVTREELAADTADCFLCRLRVTRGS